MKLPTSNADSISVVCIKKFPFVHPSTSICCSADGNYEVTMMTKATIYFNGAVHWKPPAIYKSSCLMDVEYFPYDTQSCFLKIGSWTYDGFQVRSIDRSVGRSIALVVERVEKILVFDVS